MCVSVYNYLCVRVSDAETDDRESKRKVLSHLRLFLSWLLESIVGNWLERGVNMKGRQLENLRAFRGPLLKTANSICLFVFVIISLD